MYNNMQHNQKNQIDIITSSGTTSVLFDEDIKQVEIVTFNNKRFIYVANEKDISQPETGDLAFSYQKIETHNANRAKLIRIFWGVLTIIRVATTFIPLILKEREKLEILFKSLKILP